MSETDIAEVARAFEETPHDVSAATAFIRTLVATGAREAAIGVYHRAERALREGGSEPPDELVAAFHDAVWAVQRDAQAVTPFGLPRPASRFMGRERDVQRMREAIAPGVVVTVTGAAGVGKTRLAIRVAELVAPRFALGVRYVEAAVHDAASLRAAVDTTVGDIPERGAALVVIDNVEHVVRAAEELVAALLDVNPQLAFVLTSRAALELEGPVVTLAPLDLPLEIDAPALFVRAPAVEFFVERAVSARPGFVLDEHTLPEIADVCRLLDGVPLALELAAAQLRYLVPAELVRRLRSNPREHGDALLRDQLAQSFALLQDDDRAFARRLSVYDRRWTLDEADALADGAAFEAIVRLANLSLVQVDEIAGETVYRYLETTYAYARAAFERDDDVAALELRALRATRDGAVAMMGPERTAPDAAGMAYLRLRLPTLRRALDTWAGHDPDAALEIALATRMFWINEGLHREATASLERLAVVNPALTPEKRYAVKRAIGAHLVQMHELDAARTELREALAIVELAGDAGAVRDCSLDLAVAAYEGADYDESRTLLLRVAASAVPGSDQWAFANAFLGNVATATGDFDEADARYDLVADVVRQPSSQATYLRNRAFMAALAGDAKRAAEYARGALAAAEHPAVGVQHRASVYAAAGFVHTRRGDAAGAMPWFVRSVIELAGTSSLLHVVYVLEDAACALGALGRHAEAVTLLAAVSRARERSATPADPSAMPILAETRSQARTALGERAFDDAAARGSVLTVRDATDVMLKVAADTSQLRNLLPELSTRESAIARMIGEGATNREIAGRLYLSVKTVENHIASIFRKLEVTRRSQVAALIARAGSRSS